MEGIWYILDESKKPLNIITIEFSQILMLFNTGLQKIVDFQRKLLDVLYIGDKVIHHYMSCTRRLTSF